MVNTRDEGGLKGGPYTRPVPKTGVKLLCPRLFVIRVTFHGVEPVFGPGDLRVNPVRDPVSSPTKGFQGPGRRPREWTVLLHEREHVRVPEDLRDDVRKLEDGGSVLRVLGWTFPRDPVLGRQRRLHRSRSYPVYPSVGGPRGARSYTSWSSQCSRFSSRVSRSLTPPPSLRCQCRGPIPQYGSCVGGLSHSASANCS